VGRGPAAGAGVRAGFGRPGSPAGVGCERAAGSRRPGWWTRRREEEEGEEEDEARWAINGLEVVIAMYLPEAR
jgi:hypothetical protein